MLNSICLYGRIVQTPELKTTFSGQSVVNFTLAFDSASRHGEEKPESSYVKCTAWNKMAEIIASNLTKGKPVVIQGSITQKLFQRKDGSNASEIIIQVWDATFLKDSKAPQQETIVDADYGDIPF